MADYRNMSGDSIYHVIDRFSASSSLCMELGKVFLMGYYKVRPTTLVFYGAAAVAAVFAFLQSQASQVEENRDGFVFWHNMWHL